MLEKRFRAPALLPTLMEDLPCTPPLKAWCNGTNGLPAVTWPHPQPVQISRSSVDPWPELSQSASLWGLELRCRTIRPLLAWPLGWGVHGGEVAISCHWDGQSSCLPHSPFSGGKTRNKGSRSLRDKSCLGTRNSLETKKLLRTSSQATVPLWSGNRHLYHVSKMLLSIKLVW